MTQRIEIHAQNPPARKVELAVLCLQQGSVAIFPTDSGYAIGCLLGQKSAVERIRQLRRLPKDHLFTMLCRDLSTISNYAKMDNRLFRYLKAHTPGPYTFLLQATKEVPKRLLHERRRTIGIRWPDNRVVQALLDALHEPLMSVSLTVEDYPINEYADVPEVMAKQVDVIIDSGYLVPNPTTIVDLQSGEPIIIRQGQGFEAL